MTEIVNCLPPDARKHFINLRNIRLEAETARYQTRLVELRAKLAARNQGRSGWQQMQEWKCREELLDSLAVGYTQDAFETCELYEIPLAQSICDCLVKAVESLLDIQYQMALKTQSQSGFGVKVPISIRQQGNVSRKIMPQIRVMIEKARINDQKKRAEMSKQQKHSDASIIVHGDVNSSTFQQGSQNIAITTHSNADIKQIVEEVKAQITKLNLDKTDADQVAADIATVEAQLTSPKPKHHIISESLKSIRHILEHAMGAAIAHASVPLLMAYLHH